MIVAIGTIVLRVTATTMTAATDTIEIASYAAIALFGAWLLWTKLRGGHHDHHHHHVAAASYPTHHDDDRGEPHEHDHDHPHHHHQDEGPMPTNGPASACAPGRPCSPSASVRCSGAIIILVFAWSQGLFAAGVAATFIMALGTA